MFETFKHHIQKFTAINDSEFDEVCTYFEFKKLKKKAILQYPGEKNLANYFVLSGCLRMYALHEKGMEITSDFGLTNWWLCEQKSYQTDSESNSYIQAVEPSQVIYISRQQEEQLCKEFPSMQVYFLQVYRKAFAAVQYRNMLHKQMSKEEVYLQFSRSFPEFMQRVPQYLVASYLGLTPEYLSELRKKHLS